MPKEREKQKTPPAVAVVSLGCAKNLVDTEVMCGTLAKEGWLLTGDPEEADALIVNTCAFIRDARQEADESIRRWKSWREERTDRLLVVAGCLPQKDGGRLRQRYPYVDLFLGVDDVPALPRHLRQARRNAARQVPEKFPRPEFLYNHNTPRLQLTPSSYAYVKIADGCDHACCFCTIPAIRGPYRSREPESVVEEARKLLDGGVRELNLIAQDSTAYGKDRLANDTDLADLIYRLDRLRGDFWIRVLYTHPEHVTQRFITALAQSDHLVPYVDIPLQHISDPVLKRMGRHPDAEATRAMLEQLREAVPEVTLRTTFLVGYPGETEGDFNHLYAFVREFAFERLGVFTFSPEEGTPAVRLQNEPVPEEIARERQKSLLQLQQDISRRNNRNLIGRNLKLLPGGHDDDGLITARTEGDAPEVDNLVHVETAETVATDGFIYARVTDAGPYDLYARQQR